MTKLFSFLANLLSGGRLVLLEMYVDQLEKELDEWRTGMKS